MQERVLPSGPSVGRPSRLLGMRSSGGRAIVGVLFAVAAIGQFIEALVRPRVDAWVLKPSCGLVWRYSGWRIGTGIVADPRGPQSFENVAAQRDPATPCDRR